MRSHLRAATQALSILCIAMAQVAAHEDREKTTALKGELGNSHSPSADMRSSV